MLSYLVKRLWNSGVVILAAFTFFLVPIGRRTPAQHVVRILSTPPAREAGTAFTDAAHRAAVRARAELTALRDRHRVKPRGEPKSPGAPAPSPSADP